MSSLIHVADRLLNRPLLLTPDKASVILSVLAGRIGLGEAAEASRFVGEATDTGDGGRRSALPYRRTASGTAIVSITGSLVNRGAWVGASSGLQSYEGIRHQLQQVRDDPKVSSLILDLHTPGGEAIGAFETAAAVREVASIKRTIAVVNGMAASAGYAIASGANEIVMTETGIAGSIGVILLHADMSRKLASEGISPTLIFAGGHKADGNPFEPLSADVRDSLQAEVNALYGAFLTCVAKGRGARLTQATARKTEARTFVGADAVRAGIADRMGTFESALSDLTRARSGRQPAKTRRTPMEFEDGGQGADQGDAIAAAEARGAASERRRLASIIGADGIKGNAAKTAAAIDMAFKFPTASVEDVSSFVASNVSAAPAASAPAFASLATRMAGAEPPLPNGFATTGAPASQAGRVDLVASMKRRYGVKD